MLYLITLLGAALIVLVMWLRFRQQAKGSERLKGEFVTVVTHKFRTPITRIKWISDMLRDNTITFQQKADLLKELNLAVDQVTEIIDLLTDFNSVAQKAASEYAPVSLRELVTAAIDRHGKETREKKMNFELHAADDVPSLLIDKNKIQFVVDVLIENALKYTPTEGKISVELLRRQDKILLSVRDTGIGLSPRETEAVWSGFWRSDKAKTIDTEGLGMSLHTARAIIENQGGKMWANSAGLNQGSTFYLELPIRGYNFSPR